METKPKEKVFEIDLSILEYDSEFMDLVSSKVYPGLDRSAKDNWVDKVGGLPSLIERVAKHLHYESKYEIGRAIATAVNWCKKMCSTGRAFGGKVKVGKRAQAAACKAVAQWEAKKAKSKADNSGVEFPDLVIVNLTDSTITDEQGNVYDSMTDFDFFNDAAFEDLNLSDPIKIDLDESEAEALEDIEREVLEEIEDADDAGRAEDDGEEDLSGEEEWAYGQSVSLAEIGRRALKLLGIDNAAHNGDSIDLHLGEKDNRVGDHDQKTHAIAAKKADRRKGSKFSLGGKQKSGPAKFWDPDGDGVDDRQLGGKEMDRALKGLPHDLSDKLRVYPAVLGAIAMALAAGEDPTPHVNRLPESLRKGAITAAKNLVGKSQGMSAEEISNLPDAQRMKIKVSELPPPPPGKKWAEDRTLVSVNFGEVEDFDYVDFSEHADTTPWSKYSRSDYTDEQWNRATLVAGKLPVLTPTGKPNIHGMRAAAAALAGARGGVKLSPEQKVTAKRKLKALFKRVGEDPPESLDNTEEESDVSYQLPVDFAPPESYGRGLYWKRVIKYGKYFHPDAPGGELNFDKAYGERLVQNFNEGAFESVPLYSVDLDNKHNSLPDRIRGEIKKVEARGDGVYALVETNPEGTYQLEERSPNIGCSVRIRPGYVRYRDMRQFGDSLEHLAITPKSHLGNMGAWIKAQQTDLSEEKGIALLDLTEADFVEAKGGETEMQTDETTQSTEGGEAMTINLSEIDFSELNDDEKKKIMDGLGIQTVIDNAIEPFKKQAETSEATAKEAFSRWKNTERKLAEEKLNVRLVQLSEAGVPQASIDAAKPILLSELSSQEITVDMTEGDDPQPIKTPVAEQMWKVLEQQKGVVPVGKRELKGEADLTEPDADDEDYEAFKSEIGDFANFTDDE